MCIEAIANCDAILPLKRAMGLRQDLLYTICEAFSSLFERHHDNLVKQALDCDLLKEFLAMLDSPLPQVQSPSGCKALIVKAVKAMQCSLVYGEQISAILKQSQVSSPAILATDFSIYKRKRCDSICVREESA